MGLVRASHNCSRHTLTNCVMPCLPSVTLYGVSCILLSILCISVLSYSAFYILYYVFYSAICILTKYVKPYLPLRCTVLSYQFFWSQHVNVCPIMQRFIQTQVLILFALFVPIDRIIMNHEILVLVCLL